MHQATTRAAGALLAVTAGIVAALSYAGLHRFAQQSGQSLPFLWPFALDVPAVALSLAVWRVHQLGRKAVVGRAAVVALVLLSAGLQMAVHMEPGTDLTLTPLADSFTAKIGLGLPAVVLAILWEGWLWLQRLNVTDTPDTRSDQGIAADKPQRSATVVYDADEDTAPTDAPAQPPAVEPAARYAIAPVSVTQPPITGTVTRDARPGRTPVPSRKMAAKRKPGTTIDTDTILAAVAAVQAEGLPVTPETYADKAGVSVRTGYRHLQRPEIAAVLDQNQAVKPVEQPLTTLDSAVTLAPTRTQEDTERAPQSLSATDSPSPSASAVSSPAAPVPPVVSSPGEVDVVAGRSPVGVG